LEKQANNLVNFKLLKTYITRLLFIIFLISSLNITAQNSASENAKTYTIGDITVTGNTNFSSQTVITYSGLRKGQEITIPSTSGSKIGEAIKKLWRSSLFSSIEIYINSIEGTTVNLEIQLTDLPELREVKIEGVKKSKFDDIIKENKLQPGAKVTENLITTTKNYLENSYKKKGFLKLQSNNYNIRD